MSDDAVAIQTTLQMTNTIRVVLPNGEERIDRAAGEMLASLTVADRIRLDQVLHKLVLEPRGGILGLSKSVANTPKHLAPALIDQTAAFLSEQLPAEDVTAIEAAATRNRPDGVGQTDGWLRPCRGGPRYGFAFGCDALRDRARQRERPAVRRSRDRGVSRAPCRS